MATSTRLILIVVLVIAGLYFAIDHAPPMPLNHEAVGLGANHIMHTAVGVALIAIAGGVWWTGKNKKK